MKSIYYTFLNGFKFRGAQKTNHLQMRRYILLEYTFIHLYQHPYHPHSLQSVDLFQEGFENCNEKFISLKDKFSCFEISKEDIFDLGITINLYFINSFHFLRPIIKYILNFRFQLFWL